MWVSGIDFVAMMGPHDLFRPGNGESYALDAYSISLETELNAFACHRRRTYHNANVSDAVSFLLKLNPTTNKRKCLKNRNQIDTFQKDVSVGRNFLESGYTGSASVSTGHIVAHPESVRRSGAENTTGAFVGPSYFGYRIRIHVTSQRYIATNVSLDVCWSFADHWTICKVDIKQNIKKK